MNNPDAVNAPVADVLVRTYRAVGVITKYAFTAAAGASLIILAGLTAADAFYRYALDASLSFTMPLIADAFMVSMAFCGLASISFAGSHIRVEFVRDRLPRRIQWILEVSWDVLALVLLAAISQQMVLEAMNTPGRAVGIFTVQPRISYSIVAMGTTWACVVLVSRIALEVVAPTRLAEPEKANDSDDPPLLAS